MILLDPQARLVIGHRGNRAHAPENTLASLLEAVALGVDAGAGSRATAAARFRGEAVVHASRRSTRSSMHCHATCLSSSNSRRPRRPTRCASPFVAMASRNA
jgi:hypothetical protein